MRWVVCFEKLWRSRLPENDVYSENAEAVSPGTVLSALPGPAEDMGTVSAFTLFVLINYPPLSISCRVFLVIFRYLVKYYL